MKFEIVKIFQDPTPLPNCTHSGNFHVYYPENKITVTNYKYRIKSCGSFSVKAPFQSHRYLDEEGKKCICKIPIVIFKEKFDIEELKKDLRKKLVSIVSLTNS